MVHDLLDLLEDARDGRVRWPGREADRREAVECSRQDSNLYYTGFEPVASAVGLRELSQVKRLGLS